MALHISLWELMKVIQGDNGPTASHLRLWESSFLRSLGIAAEFNMSQNGLKWHGAMVNDVRKSEATKQNAGPNSRRVSQFSLSHTQCHESSWPWRSPQKKRRRYPASFLREVSHHGALPVKSDHPKHHGTLKTGKGPRSLGHAVFLEMERFVHASIYPWHVVWTRLVVSRGTQRPFSLYLPWKSKSTIEIIGFPQVDYSFSREFESSKIGVAVIWIVGLTSRVRNNTLKTKLPRTNGKNFCKTKVSKAHFALGCHFQFSIGNTSLRSHHQVAIARVHVMMNKKQSAPYLYCVE